jgi:hypothetical protein
MRHIARAGENLNKKRITPAARTVVSTIAERFKTSIVANPTKKTFKKSTQLTI